MQKLGRGCNVEHLQQPNMYPLVWCRPGQGTVPEKLVRLPQMLQHFFLIVQDVHQDCLCPLYLRSSLTCLTIHVNSQTSVLNPSDFLPHSLVWGTAWYSTIWEWGYCCWPYLLTLSRENKWVVYAIKQHGRVFQGRVITLGGATQYMDPPLRS